MTTRTLRWPRWVLIIAALVAAAVLTAFAVRGIATSPDRSSTRCPTLEDYAAASDAPEPPDGAPDVSFPPVGPGASPTTGLLEPGTWAVLAGVDGPGAVMRIRDVDACKRLPDVRSTYYRDGSFLIATMDLRLLDGEQLQGWLGPWSVLEAEVDGRGYPTSLLPPGPPLPGSDYRTRLDPGPGFTVSTPVAFEASRPDGLVVAAYPGAQGSAVDGTAPTSIDATHVVGWRLRDGPDRPLTMDPGPSPGPTAASGILRPGETATFDTEDGRMAVLISGVESVPGYPALEPSPGREFVEVRVAFPTPIDPAHGYRGDGTSEWRAVGSDGTTLPFVPESAGTSGGIISPLMEADDSAWVQWLVIEAPPTGPLTLEFRRHGQGPVLFTYDLRAPEAPAPS